MYYNTTMTTDGRSSDDQRAWDLTPTPWERFKAVAFYVSFAFGIGLVFAFLVWQTL